MMSIFGDCFVKSCDKCLGIPARIICLCIVLLQGGILDYYLITYVGQSNYSWITFDVVIIIIFSVSFAISKKRQSAGENEPRIIGLGWFAWLVYSTALVARMVIILDRFAHLLDEKNFFGPSTLKTTLTLASCVFLFLVVTHNNSRIGGERRRYIEQLTGTVIFDIFDTVDIVDVLFDKESRDMFTPGMKPAVLVVSGSNILIPTIPLITLSLTHFGRKKISKRFVSLHKLTVALLVNVPSLVIRLVLWHGFSVGISPFIMKNILLIGIVMYEFYEHKKEKVDEKRSNKNESNNRERNGEKRISSSYNQSFTLNERI